MSDGSFVAVATRDSRRGGHRAGPNDQARCTLRRLNRPSPRRRSARLACRFDFVTLTASEVRTAGSAVPLGFLDVGEATSAGGGLLATSGRAALGSSLLLAAKVSL